MCFANLSHDSCPHLSALNNLPGCIPLAGPEFDNILVLFDNEETHPNAPLVPSTEPLLAKQMFLPTLQLTASSNDAQLHTLSNGSVSQIGNVCACSSQAFHVASSLFSLALGVHCFSFHDIIVSFTSVGNESAGILSVGVPVLSKKLMRACACFAILIVLAKCIDFVMCEQCAGYLLLRSFSG